MEGHRIKGLVTGGVFPQQQLRTPGRQVGLHIGGAALVVAVHAARPGDHVVVVQMCPSEIKIDAHPDVAAGGALAMVFPDVEIIAVVGQGDGDAVVPVRQIDMGL